ncbi:MAG TPA: 2Fe-2S iron-sulfur cluster-binding protein [Roseiarcus sp.]|jgi:carbon-monoxide dehydrogenase small subunit
MTAVSLTVNGGPREAEVEPRTHLADFLREDLLLTGTHIGCEHGVCGACTLMVDGRPVRSCLTFAVSCDGADVRTIEGYGRDPLMAALREAFSRHHALQCGYCTPGMLATAYDIVRRLPEADETRIREELAGNLCRCTGYAGIVAAIADVLLAPPAAEVIAREREGHASLVALLPAAAAAPPAGNSAAPVEIPNEFEGAPSLARTLDLKLPPDRVWALFRDLPAVIACLPGASLTDPESVTPGTPFAGRMTIALGPIRVAFRGEAVVDYDEERRSGRVRGAARDPLSRSSADGEMHFAVSPADAGSRVDIALAYRLKGPLAQFGRPAIVADVFDRVLDQFACALTAVAEGRAPAAAPALSAMAIAAEIARGVLRRLFRSDRR